jgi:peptidoglycan/xylan/chitin deacetylase (PgdA/CDA1 family)
MGKRREFIETVFGSDFFPLPAVRKAVFIFHDVSNAGDLHHSSLYSTTPQNFKKHIEFISSRFDILRLDDLLQRDRLSARKQYAAITFDDGFYSVRSTVFPFLKSKSIPFSVFLNRTAVQKNQLWLSNIVLNRNNRNYLSKILIENDIEKKEWERFYQSPIDWVKLNFQKIDVDTLLQGSQVDRKIYLDEQDVKHLTQQGVLVGSHSVNHSVLSKISVGNLKLEIFENKSYLESLTSCSIDFFAIPFGKKADYNDKVVNMGLEAGHTSILTSNPTFVNKHDLVLVPRIGLTNETIQTLKFYLNRPYFTKIDI